MAFSTRVNRRVNPVTRPVAKRLRSFAILTHRGRKSGRSYQTLINVFRRGDHFFYLTYGSDVHWVKNVLASGSCTIETRGRVVELVEPERITDPELRPAPAHVRFVERRIAGVDQYLRMRRSDPLTQRDWIAALLEMETDLAPRSFTSCCLRQSSRRDG